MPTESYLQKLSRMVAEMGLPPGAVYDVTVSHDDWCGIFSNQPCNCDPDISIVRLPDPTKN